MSNICKTVTLRTRKINHESLGIYIYAKPKSQREKDYNDRMREKAEALRCRRYESIVNERYDFFDRDKMKGDFLAYFKQKADKKNCKWQHVYKHFARFCNDKCRFDEINVDLCNKFREYLMTAPQTIHTEHKLHINSVAGYWSTFRAVLHTAYREHKIMENPNGFLERIDTIPTEKEHLSKDELVRLANTPCQYPVLKTAFLFACLTGLRKSDIKQLTWENIQPYGDGGMYVTLRMQKTKELVNNPISDEALELIGERGTGLVFVGFADKMTRNWPRLCRLCRQDDPGTFEELAESCWHHQENLVSLQQAYIRFSTGRCRNKRLYRSAHVGSQKRFDHSNLRCDG